MNDRLVALAAVALCVVALGAAAAALSSSPFAEEGSGEGEGAGGVDRPGSSGQPSDGRTNPSIGLSSDYVSYVIAVLAALSIPLLLFVYWKRSVAALVAIIVIIGALLFGFWFADSLSGFDPPSGVGNISESAEGGGDSGVSEGSESEDSSPSEPSPVLFIVVGIVLLTAVALVRVASDSLDATVSVDGSDDDEPDAGAVGRAAGRAADEIQARGGRDLSNAVYEAWYEMTDALDVENPATATPGEFAAAGVAAGMDPDRVGELTDLFEVVRYGDEQPTEHLERRAVDALRAIEAAHAGDESAAGAAGTEHRPEEDEGS